MKNNLMVRVIVWVFAMVGWPAFFMAVEPVLDVAPDRYQPMIGLSVVFLILGGWVIITYFCIGKKSSAVVVSIYFVIYVSPLPLFSSVYSDCGPDVSLWKCRWTCKSAEELWTLGVVDEYFVYRTSALDRFSYMPIEDFSALADMDKVYAAGGFCEFL